MEEQELSQIQANVRLAVDQLGPLSEVDFGLNRESVKWVEGFIERQRSQPDFDLERIGGLVGVLGSFLGACIVAATGGRWHRSDDDGWGVLLPDGSTAFPFAKVHKQFRDGVEEGESIAGFYRIAVDYLATGRIREARGDDAEGADR
ncbi:hypothetical protein FHS43_005585 [Streptosporangium becharense]|uniref:DUF3806 domain-containing protein n=1 Tax=Streptosporangium becharense TaxID=1816182 RepID=A0A7W9IMY3_9ACTN|nr:hypothetical protein [Streptosporangium becharense]MBB2914273.1 hypothetical protein [Streptosporangium becharense]MBB5823695.1 hypothetical protein [Streptosporangium becharense]